MAIVLRDAAAVYEPPRPVGRTRSRPTPVGAIGLALSQTGYGAWPTEAVDRVVGSTLRAAAAATLGVAFAIVCLGVATAASPARHGPVAVAFAPWTDADAALERIRRAGGVALDAAPSSAAALYEAAGLHLALGSGDEFRRALRREGALLLIDGPSVRRMN